MMQKYIWYPHMIETREDYKKFYLDEHYFIYLFF